jgi:hypothetical protein
MKLIYSRRIIHVFWVIFIFSICDTCLPIPSLAESDKNGVESLDGLVKHLCQDTKHVMLAPFHWEQNDLVTFATLSISAFELMLLDRDTQKSVQKNRTATTDRISKWTDRYTKRVTNLSIGGLYLSGVIFHDRKSKETALLCMESVALAEGVTIGLKHLIGRSRPFGNKGAFDFNPMKFPPPSYSQSFPSGHATTAFAFSSVIAEQYRSWWVKLSCYSFATVVALGRVNNNFHFISDVFWGGVIGITVGRCLVRFHRKEENKSGCELVSMCESNDLRIGVLIWFK